MECLNEFRKMNQTEQALTIMEAVEKLLHSKDTKKHGLFTGVYISGMLDGYISEADSMVRDFYSDLGKQLQGITK